MKLKEQIEEAAKEFHKHRALKLFGGALKMDGGSKHELAAERDINAFAAGAKLAVELMLKHHAWLLGLNSANDDADRDIYKAMRDYGRME